MAPYLPGAVLQGTRNCALCVVYERSYFCLAPAYCDLACRDLSTPKDRLSSLVERKHAFAAVFGRDQAIIRLDLERETVPHRHLQTAMNRLLGLTHRERSVGGDAPSDCERALHEVGGLDHPVDQPPCLRLRRGERKARQDQFLG